MAWSCLNQQVNRNRDRFPDDLMVKLSDEEFAALRLQSATSKVGRGQQRKCLPYAFTEHGAIMASMVLNSPRATALSVYVVRAFVELRGMLSSNQELATKEHTLERKVSAYERNIAELLDSVANLLASPPTPPTRPIGFVTPQDKEARPRERHASPERGRDQAVAVSFRYRHNTIQCTTQAGKNRSSRTCAKDHEANFSVCKRAAAIKKTGKTPTAHSTKLTARRLLLKRALHDGQSK